MLSNKDYPIDQSLICRGKNAIDQANIIINNLQFKKKIEVFETQIHYIALSGYIKASKNSPWNINAIMLQWYVDNAERIMSKEYKKFLK